MKKESAEIRTTIPDPSITFEEWLKANSDEIAEVQALAKTELPSDPAQIQADLSTTSRNFPRAAEWLADVEGFLVKCRAFETLSVKADPKYADLTGDERKAIVAGRLADIARTRDILRATVAALHERSFHLMGQRRYAETEMKLSGHGD